MIQPTHTESGIDSKKNLSSSGNGPSGVVAFGSGIASSVNVSSQLNNLNVNSDSSCSGTDNDNEVSNDINNNIITGKTIKELSPDEEMSNQLPNLAFIRPSEQVEKSIISPKPVEQI